MLQKKWHNCIIISRNHTKISTTAKNWHTCKTKCTTLKHIYCSCTFLTIINYYVLLFLSLLISMLPQHPAMAVKMKLPPAEPSPAIAWVASRHFFSSVIFPCLQWKWTWKWKWKWKWKWIWWRHHEDIPWRECHPGRGMQRSRHQRRRR